MPRIRGGSVAFSCILHCLHAKPAASPAKRTKSTRMRASVHPWRIPPHCSASNRHVSAGMTSTVPMTSNSLIFSDHVRPVSGTVRRSRSPKATKIMAAAPRGRLRPKQARHEKRSIRAPPTIGELTMPKSCAAPTTDVQRGSLCRGKHCETMTTEPEDMPAAPMPARARPSIKTQDVGATAQSREPVSKTESDARYRRLAGTMLNNFP